MSWPKMRKVSEDELLTFVKSYPRELVGHCVTVVDPPLWVYIDQARGVWPSSVVASYSKDWDGKEFDWKIRDEDGVGK